MERGSGGKGGEKGRERLCQSRERENSVVTVRWLHSCCVSWSLLSRVNDMLASLLDLSSAPDTVHQTRRLLGGLEAVSGPQEQN